MEKALKLYNSNGAFPSAENQIEILGFNYDAKRMGGAPIITGTVMYGSCLDGVWSDDVYVEFNGERYYLKQTPTSSFSNADARYKHECEFVSERIKLDNVYFIDAIVGNPQESEAVATNSATFSFFGTIVEFVKRLNAGLQYSKLQSVNEYGEISGYHVEVGNLVDKDGNEFDKEEKFLSFDKVPFSVALQESYNQFGIPYYFEGKKIVFGFFQHTINTVFKYGVDESLLSITKNNANQKIINRCTGVGSEENIPYYYPNEHPLGIVDTYLNDELNNELVTNNEKFGARVKNGTELRYTETKVEELVSSLEIYNQKTYNDYVKNYGNPNKDYQWFTIPDFIYNEKYDVKKKAELGGYQGFNPLTETITFTPSNIYVAVKVKLNHLLERLNDDTPIDINTALQGLDITSGDYRFWVYIPYFINNDKTTIAAKERDEYYITKKELGSFNFFYVVFKIDQYLLYGEGGKDISRSTKLTLRVRPKESFYYYAWENENDKTVKLENYGLAFNREPKVGDKITFQTREGSLMPYQNALMPPIYIKSGGKKRFYNALNTTYQDENGNYYEFVNPYSDSKRKEHIVDFPDIKPSIENVKNDADKEYINSFIDIKFDDNDNDETYEEEDGGSLKYLHPYFYVKLRKFDGKYGFNLFDHASEQCEMTISMTSGHCGACNFVIGVDENTKKNILQVDDDGNLVWDDEKGMPKFGDPQDRQNDTRNNEVWLALKKDIETYKHIMPSGSLKPVIGDTFVITNISFPTVYLRQAEERLKEEIIKFMYENNMEKFTFSIKFSRIYLEENPEVLALLNENSLITVEYNGKKPTLYVNSFAYKMTADEALPEITIELADTLSASQNALQTAISEVKTDVLNRVQKMDIAAMVAAKFISKESEDYAKQKITFNRGLNVGTQDEVKAKVDETGTADFVSQIIRQYISTPQFIDGFAGSGFKLWLDENGKSNLTVDSITARETFRVFEMLVTKLRAVNGGLFVSAANGTIKEVVDGGEYYDIILENDNTFIAGDYMRCQVMSGLKMMDYWVEVESTSGNACRVLKSEFGDASPFIGQDVVLDGSKNVNRQSAIYITANEGGLPRIEVLNGISTKNHDGCLRTRLGSLEDVYDSVFGGKLNGYGLYSDNVYLKGDFILRNRDTNVETVFEIQDGKIKGGIAQTQSESIRGKSFLYNASFIKGLDGWLTSNEENVYFSGEALLFDSSSLLYQSVSISSEPIYENVFFVTINNGWIKQSNLYFVNKPEFETDKQYPLNFSCNIRCATTGTLLVKVGENILFEQEIQPSDDFIPIDVDNLTWNGQGDFYLEFTGVADFYGLTIFTEKTEVRHKTFFDMSDRLIEFGAQQLDESGNVSAESGIMIKPQGTDIYVFDGGKKEYVTLGKFYIDEDGKKKIKLTGDEIILSGDVSANGNVSIDAETGTLTAKDGVFENGVFSGKVTSESGKIGGFEISDTQLENTQTENEVTTTLGLSSRHIYFSEKKKNSEGKDVQTKVGFFGTTTTTSGYELAPFMRVEVDEDKTTGSNTGLYIESKGSMSGQDTSANYGNHAILSPHGCYTGFRMRTRRISNNTSLSVLDNIILVNKIGITLTLPANAEDGQIYIIKSYAINPDDKTVIFTCQCQGDDEIWGWNDGNSEDNTLVVTTNRTLILNYDAINKRWIASLLSTLD